MYGCDAYVPSDGSMRYLFLRSSVGDSFRGSHARMNCDEFLAVCWYLCQRVLPEVGRRALSTRLFHALSSSAYSCPS